MRREATIIHRNKNGEHSRIVVMKADYASVFMFMSHAGLVIHKKGYGPFPKGRKPCKPSRLLSSTIQVQKHVV